MRTSRIWIIVGLGLLAVAACTKEHGMTGTDFGPGADADGHGRATAVTAKANAAVAAALPLDDPQDFEDARRGFVATDDPLVVKNAAGARDLGPTGLRLRRRRRRRRA